MRRTNKAMALIITMWAVAVMVVIAVTVAGTVYMSQGQLRAIRTSHRNELATQSAIATVCTKLLTDVKTPNTIASFPLAINGIDVTLKDDKIENESARLNANTATVEMLTKLAGMDATAAGKFIAARDKLAELRASTKSDTAANWPIANPMELAKILSAATSLKYLEQTQTQADEDNWYRAAGISGELAAIMKNLTVYSRQSNTDAAGSARVNINAATSEALTKRLGDVLTPNQIEAIIQSRTDSPFENIVQLLTRQYSPTIDGKVVRVSLSTPIFQKIADRITTSDKSVLVGLIDVTTCSQDVLRTLPGLTEGDVSDILSWQQFKADPADIAEQGIGTLLDAISPQTLETIIPYITTRSQQYRCVLIKKSAGYLTQYTECVVERAGTNFGTVFRYDWSVFASATDNQ